MSYLKKHNGRGLASSADRSYLVALVALLAAVAAGAAIGFGSPAFLLPAMILIALAILSILAEVPRKALLGWLVVGPAMVPFFRFPAGPGAIITFDRLWILGLGWMCLATLVDLPRAAPQTKRLMWSFGALSALMFLRALMGSAGGNSGLTIWLDAFLLPVAVLLLVRSVATTEKYINQVLIALGVGGGIAAAIGIAGKVAGFSLTTNSGGALRVESGARDGLVTGIVRIAGPYAVPEVFVSVLLTSLAATVCWTLRRGPTSRVAAGVLIALQLAGIYLSYFRTGWAAALLILVGALAIRKGEKQRAVVIVMLGLLMANLLVAQVAQLDVSGAVRLSNSQNTYGRLAAYKQALTMIENSPVIGVGIGGYNATSLSLPPVFVNGVRNVSYPHNSLIQIAVEGGIILLAALLAFMWSVFRLLRRLWRIADRVPDQHLALCVSLACSAYLLYGTPLSLVEYGGPSMALFALIGVCCAKLDSLTLSD